MGGALLELVAIGKQDKHIIGNPQISFFKTIYKRHTNFSLESIPQYFQEQPNFEKKVTCIIERKGDLLGQIILEVDVPALGPGISWINGLGHHMIRYVELTIGGITINKMSGKYLDIYSELNLSNDKRTGYYQMVGKNVTYNNYTQSDALKLFIPLPFWFCQDISNALPLVAMQYSEVRVNVSFRPFNECWYSGTSMSNIPTTKEITSAVLYCDYIFLDTYERKKFASSGSLEYLIEQVQTNDGNSVLAGTTVVNNDLFFNHPIKELIWVYQPDDVSLTNDWCNYSITLDDDSISQTQLSPISNVQLKLNGVDRFEKRSGEYFRLVQPYQRHTSISTNFIYVYSFALNPEAHQPSGTCNFSKLDQASLNIDYKSDILTGETIVYGHNYNILQIKNGMTGLLYS